MPAVKKGAVGKGKVDLLDGNQVVAEAIKLAKVQSIPLFPITPQTEFIEIIADWKGKGIYRGEFKVLESEHSVLSAAVASEMTGARTFTFSGSQGIMLMHEIMYVASGTRTPLVMVNGSRGLSAPITLWPDHNDFLAMRDSGWLMMATETNQELLDSIIISYKISENKKVLLPFLVNMDGFIQSTTRTGVSVPEQKKINRFLPKLKLDVRLDVNKPMTLGLGAMEDYMFFKSQMHSTQLDSMKIIKDVQKQYGKLTGRHYGVIDKYKMNDAKAAIVMIGADSTIAKGTVDAMRKKGKKVGLLRLRLLRPFPEKEIRKALENVRHVGVCDQNIAPGMSGILYPEIKAALYGSRTTVSNYIFGLGGKFVSKEDFSKVFSDLLRSNKEKRAWIM